MAEERTTADKLRAFLRELDQRTRDLLVTELERADLRGDLEPALAFVLGELRHLARDGHRQLARVGNPQRLFFTPLDPFLIDEVTPTKIRGRVPRRVLIPVWTFLSRDLLPEAASAYNAAANEALLEGDPETARKLARELQDAALPAIIKRIAESAKTDIARQKLVAQLGEPRDFEELVDIVAILRARDAMATIAPRLPLGVKSLGEDMLDHIVSVLDAPGLRSVETVTYAMILIMGRLQHPWQVIRFALRAAESDQADKIAATPFAFTVGLALGELERLTVRVSDALTRGDMPTAVAALKDIHDGVRGLRTEIDLSDDSAWARRLAQVRADISKRLRPEIEGLPGQMRRMLRPRTAREIAPGMTLDPADVDAVESGLDLLAACRNYAGEIALNEITVRLYADLQTWLEPGTQVLLENLRSASPEDHRFRQSQVDAAVRFCGKVFGASYAALLAKAADIAADDRKVARTF